MQQQQQQQQKQQAINALNSLYEKYENTNNTSMLDKLTNYISEQLPTVMANIEKNNTLRIQRTEELTFEQNMFISSFFENQQYFYASSTEYFFAYDGNHFTNISEDEIIHKILSSISRERTLMAWKQKTKATILKKIKENLITSCIPDSTTIQDVLSYLSPSVFSTKTEAKYFLTVIGDNILKKTESFTLIHMLYNKTCSVKQWINQLNVACQLWFGTTLNQSFKYKYHPDHVYSTIRLIMPKNVPMGSWNYSHLLDLLCVACHYSNRYGGSETYLLSYANDTQFVKAVRSIQNELPTTIIDDFIHTMLMASSTDTHKISWKNMQFLWKLYLNKRELPNILSLLQLKNGLCSANINYNTTEECFTSYTSMYLPLVHDFLKFWSANMIEDETEIELEIGEIAVLFKQWNHNVGMSEAEIINVLQHFYPQLEIDQQKFIYKTKCKLWDKSADIDTAMSIIDSSNNSVYDCYQKYCELSDKKALKVSKLYFEKYIAAKRCV